MDSTTVSEVTTGINLATAAFYAITALVSFVVGRIHALRKKR